MTSTTKRFNLGRHILAEFYDCDPNILNNAELIENNMVQAAKEAKATIVQQNFHHFSPYGVSGVVVIAESHLTIHTWPEYGYAAVDLFTCGDSVDPMISYNFLKAALGSETAFYSELKRGMLSEKDGEVVKVPFQVNRFLNDEAFDTQLPLQPAFNQKQPELTVVGKQNATVLPFRPNNSPVDPRPEGA